LPCPSQKEEEKKGALSISPPASFAPHRGEKEKKEGKKEKAEARRFSINPNILPISTS